jgi:lipopolysaccharide biosynthesis glycosyltransferase
MINIFIGYDEGEKIAFHVLAESIRKHASVPVSITPICLHTLRNIFNRPKTDKQSTDFAFSRFLVPYLSDYKGWSLFLDCDMMFRTDIKELWDTRDENKSVMVCKHDYVPNATIKFRGAKNLAFPKKNWSSVMLFKDNVGSLPIQWNWLVGETKYPYNKDVKNVHWTLGGPYFKDYADSDYCNEWFDIYYNMSRIDL